jgi:hypothetical protein
VAFTLCGAINAVLVMAGRRLSEQENEAITTRYAAFTGYANENDVRF